MYKQNVADPTTDPFNSVESLAEQIFERIPALEPAEDTPEVEDHPDSNVVSLFSRKGPQQNPNPSRAEQLLGSLLNVLDQGGKVDDIEDRPVDFAHAPDIGYEAAFRRSQLPQGIEPLRAQPTATTETETLSNIRAMMEVQEVEREEARIAMKREKAKEVLAPIEPQEKFEPSVEPQPKASRATLRRRVLSILDKAFRNYYFLAIALSGWCTLAMMVVIDPAVGRVLGMLSLVLLMASVCMHSHKSAQASPN